MPSQEIFRQDCSAVIQVQALPRIFHARSVGTPDRLFLPLLKAARQAYSSAGCSDAIAITPAQGFHAATYMLGLLCRDETFTPGRPIETENVYSLDFLADVLTIRTECWTMNERSVASFKVVFEGPIAEGYFSVHDPVTGKRMMTFSEEDATRANFFTEELPVSAYYAKRYSIPIAQNADPIWLLRKEVDMRLIVPIGGQNTVSIRLHKAIGRNDVLVEDKSGNILQRLQTECLRDMDEIRNILKRQLGKGASAGSRNSPPASPGGPEPAPLARPFSKNPLQESLLAMGDKLPSAISKFYELLFANHPEVAILFEHADLKRQKNRLLRAISAMSGSFDDPEQMTRFFQDFAGMYQAFGVKPEYMGFYSACILGALKDAAADGWNDVLAEHWSCACRKATEIMTNEMVQV